MNAFKSVFGILLIVYPIVQKLAAVKGIHLPDLGDLGSIASQSVGTITLAQSDKLINKQP